jgi:hypothetical protein
MENQSTNDNSVKSTENKIICRKCGGPHFTIKCGKEKQTEEKTKEQLSTKPEVIKDKEEAKNTCRNDKRFNENSHEKKQYFKTAYRVKLSDLPTDMTEEEMTELTYDWGHVFRIRVINYPETSVAYIDFGYEEEADYFVKAMDKTPFEYLIVSAQRVESQRQEDSNSSVKS